MSLARRTAAAAPAKPPLRLTLAGVAAEPRPSGALWLPGPRALVVADLHLGKAERLARRGGALLPPYADQETLANLAREVALLEPDSLVSLGDAFDDDAAAGALSDEAAAALSAIAGRARLVWVRGNHDPAPQGIGAAAEAWRCGGIVGRHLPSSAPPGPGSAEICGHLHPKATLTARGRRLSRRCFLAAAPELGQRLILPAFGAYTGGLDAADPVFDPLVGESAAALICAQDRVVVVGRARLDR